jgi:hypothetical protein
MEMIGTVDMLRHLEEHPAVTKEKILQEDRRIINMPVPNKRASSRRGKTKTKK